MYIGDNPPYRNIWPHDNPFRQDGFDRSYIRQEVPDLVMRAKLAELIQAVEKLTIAINAMKPKKTARKRKVRTVG